MLASMISSLASAKISHADDSGLAAHSVSNSTQETAQERSKRLQEIFYRKNGGWISKPGTGLGLILIRNEQKRVSSSLLSADIAYLRKFTKLPVSVADGDPANEPPSQEAVKKLNANLAVFVRDDDSNPSTLLVAPDDHWAVVNIAALAKDNPSQATLEFRFRKEVTRAFAFLCGGVNSQYDLTPVNHVKDLRDLDRIDMAEMPADMMARFPKYALGYGITQYEIATYKVACKRGWAPAPTNDVQKAIWEQVKAEQSEKPTNPMRILPGQKPSGK